MRKTKGGKPGVMERAAEIFDIPGDLIAGMPRVSVTGGRDILIENHKGILEYGDNDIHINGGRVIIKMKGERLRVKSMNATELSISGQIFSIEFVY